MVFSEKRVRSGLHVIFGPVAARCCWQMEVDIFAGQLMKKKGFKCVRCQSIHKCSLNWRRQQEFESGHCGELQQGRPVVCAECNGCQKTIY